MTVTIEKTGRRYYLIGNTFAIKDAIKDAGGHFDGERKAWWLSNAAEAERLITEASDKSRDTVKAKNEAGISTDDECIIGRVEYNSKNYYLLYDGHKDGKKIRKLAFTDGSKVFWPKDADNVTIKSKYQNKRSIDDLRAFAEKAKSGQAGTCDNCGSTSSRLVQKPDSSGIMGHCCPTCAQGPDWERSYC